MSNKVAEIFRPITKKLYPREITNLNTEKDCMVKAIDEEYLGHWVCNWCGSDQVYEKVFINMNTLKNDYSKETTEPEYAGDCCGQFEYPMHQQEWEEKVIEDCNGNKDKYMKILDGGRA